jgi:hypothetical protein
MIEAPASFRYRNDELLLDSHGENGDFEAMNSLGERAFRLEREVFCRAFQEILRNKLSPTG